MSSPNNFLTGLFFEQCHFPVILTCLLCCRKTPHIPEVRLPQEPFVEIASALRSEINNAFAELREISSGRDLKKFLGVILIEILYFVCAQVLKWNSTFTCMLVIMYLGSSLYFCYICPFVDNRPLSSSITCDAC